MIDAFLVMISSGKESAFETINGSIFAGFAFVYLDIFDFCCSKRQLNESPSALVG